MLPASVPPKAIDKCVNMDSCGEPIPASIPDMPNVDKNPYPINFIIKSLDD